MKIVAISDTHGLHQGLTIPPGDVLVHAGDVTRHGTLAGVRDFDDFLASLPHPHKIVIAGNHDFCFEQDRERAEIELAHAIYLQDQAVTIDGVMFYGSPWQPWFHDWAFNLQRGPEIRAKWELIPPGTDVLITHGPPRGHRDRTTRGEDAGCADLLEVVERIRPRVHIFGHIHEAVGMSSNGRTTFINASICDAAYRPVNPPTVYELEL
jgi:Icc-related predicted phosphoesterase